MELDEIKIGKAEDLRDKEFGYLTVLYRTHNIGKHTAWKCKCKRDGNIVTVRMDHLKEGRVISCGCYNAEKGKYHIKNINYKGKNMKDITGMESGFLIALEPTEKRISYGVNSSHVVWKCLCRNPEHEFPVYCEATTTDITSKNKTSCGCSKSKGEIAIINLLIQNNIFYEKEKKFNNCKSDKGYFYRFDFYVNNQYIIEFDGMQHYSENKVGWNESLSEIQKRDNDKTEWCKNNNIPLIRIPYWHLNNLTIEDLCLNTSKFII